MVSQQGFWNALHQVLLCCCLVIQSIRLGRVPMLGNCIPLCPFPSHQDLIHQTATDQYLFWVSLARCWRNTSMLSPLVTWNSTNPFRLPVGLKTSRSTVSALLLTIHEWLQLLESGKDILVYRKAFDSVPHAPLINRLQEIGLHINLLAWLIDYLTLQRQQVVIDGITSMVTSGVPQGSVLGPLLFYINDITKVTLSSQSHSVLYADNILLFREISHPEDFLAVQSDNRALKEWSDEHTVRVILIHCGHLSCTILVPL